MSAIGGLSRWTRAAACVFAVSCATPSTIVPSADSGPDAVMQTEPPDATKEVDATVDDADATMHDGDATLLDADATLDLDAGPMDASVPPPDAMSDDSTSPDGPTVIDDAGDDAQPPLDLDGSVCNGGLRYRGDASILSASCQSDFDCTHDSNVLTSLCPSAICLQGRCWATCGTAGYIATNAASATCYVHVCDADGGIYLVDDPWNMPLHGPCLAYICLLGGPGNPTPQQIGTPCGVNLTCTDAGYRGDGVFNTACTGCTQPSDCDGIDTPCNQRTCKAGVCGRAFAPRLTVCSDAGDFCDGLGWCGLFMPNGGFPLPGFE
jgi:hypothetical protein